VYVPFWIHGSFDSLYRFLDGPLYVVVAKTLYDFDTPGSDPFIGWSRYYSLYLIGYPLLIRLFSFIGYYPSMLLTTGIFSTLDVLLIYQITKKYKYSANPLLISLIWVFLPPRWYIYHCVGASEPLFLFFSLLSFYYFKEERYLISSVFASLATVTRISGLVLFASYTLLLLTKRRISPIVFYFLIPITLAAHFYWYQIVFHDFFMYFKVQRCGGVEFGFLSLLFDSIEFPFHFPSSSGGNALTFPTVTYVVLIYFTYGLSIFKLYKRGLKDPAFFSIPFYVLVLCINHEDIARYAIPLFFVLHGYDEWINTRSFKSLLPLFFFLSYLYAVGYIPYNTVPNLGGIQ